MILLALVYYSPAQIIFPVLSPKGTITQWVGNTYVTIEYERPAARGRKIFGGLVPFGRIWRTGAGYSTKIGFDQPVKVGNEDIPAGKYSIFTIPGKESWIVILNADTTLYGTYGYNSEKDIVRFMVRPEKTSRFHESLTIDLDIIPNDGRIYISWENTQVSFDIKTTIDEDVIAGISEQLLEGKSEDPNQYALAAEYLILQNTNLYDALKLADKAIEIDENTWARILKLQIYEKLHLYSEALKEVKKSIEIVKKRDYSKEEYRKKDIKYWENHSQRIERKM